ncbi:acyl dehydratase [Bradyrhizobium sp. LB7.1]
MPNRLETHRVVAYNTAKQSENKMHDDNVARRFGFSGGLVPGVDVFAYMMHVPVARWGRDFLSRGLVEARFIKPVYDGETADVDATEHNGLLTIEVVQPHRALRHRDGNAAGGRRDCGVVERVYRGACGGRA